MSSDKLFVVAIDFGTTYSGYAFSTKSNKDQIYTYNDWKQGIAQAPKTPTNILFTPSQDFHSFGYEAEDKYAELSEYGKNKEWYYFRRFKMTLYKNMKKENLNERTSIKDFTGKEMPAIDVFSSGIEYLKNHLFSHFQERVPLLREHDIHWVLTVPAIWDEAAKKFMRKAAEKAGIAGNQLTLALEPESAALFCQLGKDRSGLSPREPGQKFLLLDCGGGTVDITVHEVRSDKTLKEIHRASGGPWGGITVDDAFAEYLLEIFGYDIIQAIPKNEVFELDRSFESFKKKVCLDTKMYYIQIPHTLKRVAPASLMIADKLKLNPAIVKGFFDNSVNKICNHIKEIFSTYLVQEVNTIILVGGFSENEFLREAIRTRFPLKRVIAPTDPSSAVVKGAVEFGHSPESIKYRKSPYTYGIGTYTTFLHGIHPRSKLIFVNGEEYCADFFSVHVIKDQLVETGTAISNKSYTPVYPNQTSMKIQVVTSTSVNPTFITDPGCSTIGNFAVEIPHAFSGYDRSVNVKMIFSGTELKVEATDKHTGKMYNATFEFD